MYVHIWDYNIATYEFALISGHFWNTVIFISKCSRNCFIIVIIIKKLILNILFLIKLIYLI